MSTSDKQRLTDLLAAGHSCIRLVTSEEREAAELAIAAAASRKTAVRLWTAVGGVRNGIVVEPPIPDTAHLAAACTWLIKNIGDQDRGAISILIDASPAISSDHVTARAWRELVEASTARGGAVIMIDSADTTLPIVKTLATHFECALPDEASLDDLIKSTLRLLHRRRPVTVDISKRDFDSMLKNLRGLSRRQVSQIIRDVVSQDHEFKIEDLDEILARKRQMLQSGGLLEYVQSPVSMDSVGGLDRLKGWLMSRKDAVADEARSFGIQPPRGVLILGVQGAGKSLCAKAIATAWRRPLLRMDMGALYDKFIGESERNLREALHQAEAMSPNVLWFDEIEKAFAGTSGSGGGSDSGLSKRMFGMLLTWMQEHRSSVFVAATANDIESLPPELMRKGRFDEIFFVDLPSPAAREAIFRIHLQKRSRTPAEFDLPRLVAESDGFSGAEIEQAISASLFAAFGQNKRPLTTQDILATLSQSPPLSVTRAEKIAELRAWAQGRCLMAE